MPVSEIIYQPNIAQLLAAYRPIRFIVKASGTNGEDVPPYVSCDIYIADVYYKSKFCTAPTQINDEDSLFEFDIAEALQEYLQPDIAVIDNQNVLPAPHMSAKVYCKFRASGKDADGFTIEEPTIPVQATKFTPAVAGTGLLSNSFFVVNSAVQHEDNQNLASHLAAFKQGGWKADAYPLTHRKTYHFCPGDSDHFPVVFKGDCVEADLKMHYRLKGSSSFQTATANDINTCDPITYSIDVVQNRIDVSLDDPVPAGHFVLAQYRKHNTVGANWVDAGKFTTQNFSFSLHPGNRQFVIFVGDYDFRVIHFCSSCISADPVTGSFEMTGAISELVWEGYNPFCVQQVFDDPVYMVLELRDPDSEEVFLPSNTVRNSRTLTSTAKLYAKFFSDPLHLNPVVVDIDTLKVYIKQAEAGTNVQGIIHFNWVIQNVLPFTVDADGVEVLLGEVDTQITVEQFGPNSQVLSTQTRNFVYSPYPDHQLVAGNTGLQGFGRLREVNGVTRIPTGATKVNDDEDPDYIEPGPNAASCPAGPDRTYVQYGTGLEIAKVEFRYGAGNFVYAPSVVDTTVGGWQYVLQLPTNTSIALSVKAKKTNTIPGMIRVRVITVNAAGVQQVITRDIPQNIETTIPLSFQNIQYVNISST